MIGPCGGTQNGPPPSRGSGPFRFKQHVNHSLRIGELRITAGELLQLVLFDDSIERAPCKLGALDAGGHTGNALEFGSLV